MGRAPDDYLDLRSFVDGGLSGDSELAAAVAAYNDLLVMRDSQDEMRPSHADLARVVAGIQAHVRADSDALLVLRDAWRTDAHILQSLAIHYGFAERPSEHAGPGGHVPALVVLTGARGSQRVALGHLAEVLGRDFREITGAADAFGWWFGECDDQPTYPLSVYFDVLMDFFDEGTRAHPHIAQVIYGLQEYGLRH